MLGKKSKPVIGILTGSLVPCNRSGTVGIATKTHFESKPQSAKGLRTFDLGAVGLGIVAALEQSSDVGSEFPVCKPLFSRNLSRSNPIPLNSPNKNRGASEEMEMESFEEYTIVTRHSPNKSSYSRVYGDDRTPFRIQNSSININRASVFQISPVRSVEAATGAPPPDFLSSCSMCRKKLQGKDIYMYRGEKAFCSTECRYRQMVMDERQEKCSSIRRVDVSRSPCANSQIFAVGIMAT